MLLINTISGDKGLRKTGFGPCHSVLGEKSPLNTHAPSQLINTESPHCEGSSSLYSVVKYEFCPEPFWTNEHNRDSISNSFHYEDPSSSTTTSLGFDQVMGKPLASAQSALMRPLFYFIFLLQQKLVPCVEEKMKIEFLST